MPRLFFEEKYYPGLCYWGENSRAEPWGGLEDKSGNVARIAFRCLHADFLTIIRTHRAPAQQASLEALAVQAAKVRLTVDLWGEIQLWKLLNSPDRGSQLPAEVTLRPSDVLIPALAKLTAKRFLEASPHFLEIPNDPAYLPHFAERLDAARNAASDASSLPSLSRKRDSQRTTLPLTFGEWISLLSSTSSTTEEISAARLAERLAIRGLFRWRLATTSLFLARLCELPWQDGGVDSPLRRAVVTTGIVYMGEFEGAFKIPLLDRLRPLLEHFLNSDARLPISREKLTLLTALLEVESDNSALNQMRLYARENFASETEIPDWILSELQLTEVCHLVQYILSPDPLKLLADRVIGADVFVYEIRENSRLP